MPKHNPIKLKTTPKQLRVPQDIQDYAKSINEPLATFLWRCARRIIRLENKE